ncbi:conserved hypothetical protein [Methylococcus capsulatus str. Bath]|uniref:DUF3489 domain-containing protein n=1 Tax=Methylococcus capsulatus (strain ATCC 33009 / NCIMB 11132 / Bath) TaxID=243233 RepID=Q603Z0_METCA|nr:DUF3489 domain-containing protein [Methylococcus capsulatus]AAU91212.1 conserved hypothetical protein [Methylococcus capsulatus str. Bath]
MTTIQLTPAQHAIVAYAIEHTDGKIVWFPDNVKGGARKKVLDGLFRRALITSIGADWFVAAEGYDAMGCPRPAPAPVEPDEELEAAVSAAEATWAQRRSDAKPRTRENERSEVSRGEAERVRSIRQNSKQAEVIRMLKRPEGATVRQICEATGWQAHTVRGTFAGAFKKKLGLVLVSEKLDGGERVYRIVAEDVAA